jgi:hypothetical protein
VRATILLRDVASFGKSAFQAEGAVIDKDWLVSKELSVPTEGEEHSGRYTERTSPLSPR